MDNKILINSNIIVKRNKKDTFNVVEKNKMEKENSIYNICEIFIKVLSAGIYDDLISKDYDNYNLKENDIYRLSSEIFKFVLVKILENN